MCILGHYPFVFGDECSVIIEMTTPTAAVDGLSDGVDDEDHDLPLDNIS